MSKSFKQFDTDSIKENSDEVTNPWGLQKRLGPFKAQADFLFQINEHFIDQALTLTKVAAVAQLGQYPYLSLIDAGKIQDTDVFDAKDYICQVCSKTVQGPLECTKC